MSTDSILAKAAAWGFSVHFEGGEVRADHPEIGSFTAPTLEQLELIVIAALGTRPTVRQAEIIGVVRDTIASKYSVADFAGLVPPATAGELVATLPIIDDALATKQAQAE